MRIQSLCLLASGMAFSSTAIAQDLSLGELPPGQGVADRARPAWDPLGIRAGSLLLFPKVTGQAEYDDNVLASPAGARGDRTYMVQPELRVRTDFNRHALDARAYYSRSFHEKLKTEDVTEFGIVGRGVLDVTRRTRIRLTGSAERQAEERSSLASFSGSRRPVRFDRYTAGAGLEQEFGRLTLSGRGEWRKLAYDDASDPLGNVIDMSFRDLTIKSGMAQASYRLRSGVSLLLRGGLERRTYKLRPGDPGFDPFTQIDRSSRGARIEGGLGLELTSLIYGTVRVGYLRQNYRDPQLRDVKGLSYAADLLWNITPLTTLRFAGERSVDETSSQTTAGNLRTEGRFTVDHELLRNVILTGSLRHARINPAGPTAKSKEYEAELGARYLLNRNVSLRGGYAYEKRSSANAGLGFKSNRIFLALTLTR